MSGDGWAELTGSGVSILDEDLPSKANHCNLMIWPGVTVQGRGRLRREGDEQLRVNWAESAVFHRTRRPADWCNRWQRLGARRGLDSTGGRLTLGLQTVDGETKPQAFAAEGDVNLTFVSEDAALRGERVDASFDPLGQPTELRLRGNALVQQAGREIAAEAIDARFGTGEDNETTITSVLAETQVCA